MATFYRCDRCFRDTPDEATLQKVTLPATTSFISTKVVELCRACLVDLHRCAEPLPRLQEAK